MIRRLAILLLVVCSSANAQFKTGQILTAAQLNAAFANVLSLSGGTLSGPLTVPTLTVTGVANIPNISVSGGTISNATITNSTITGGTISGLSSPLPVASGGTGAANQAGALTNLLGSSTVPVANGGTGATTASAARTNLGTASTGANTFTGSQTIGLSNPLFTINDTSGTNAATIALTSNGTSEWTLFKSSANNFGVGRFVSGSFVDNPISIANSTGAVTLTQRPVFGSATPWDSANLNFATPPAIGGTTPAAGAFTTLSASSTVSGTGFSTYLASPPAIGGTAAAAGSFTTLSASSTVSGTGFSTYLAAPPAIGTTTPAAGKFTTLQATSTITPSSTAGIVGTTTNDNANSGSVGEYLTAGTATTSATTSVALNATSISLTAGDWDVSGQVLFSPAGSTVTNLVVAGISTTSGAFQALPSGGFNNEQVIAPFNSAGVANIVAAPITRVSIASTTTVFLVAQANFTVSTLTVSGFIRARRVR